MKVHTLKTWPKHFQAVLEGRKTFEIRRNDRGGFNVGDVLHLVEFDPELPEQAAGTGRTVNAEITYVTDGRPWIDPDGHVVIAIQVERACRVCACTEDRACPGRCWWIEHRLCSSCGTSEAE